MKHPKRSLTRDVRTRRPLHPGRGAEELTPTTSSGARRALVVDEGWRTGSLAAEVSARIMEGGFYDLDAPCSVSAARKCRSRTRVTDGHRGGRFLAAVERLLQAPERL